MRLLDKRKPLLLLIFPNGLLFQIIRPCTSMHSSWLCKPRASSSQQNLHILNVLQYTGLQPAHLNKHPKCTFSIQGWVLVVHIFIEYTLSNTQSLIHIFKIYFFNAQIVNTHTNKSIAQIIYLQYIHLQNTHLQCISLKHISSIYTTSKCTSSIQHIFNRCIINMHIFSVHIFKTHCQCTYMFNTHMLNAHIFVAALFNTYIYIYSKFTFSICIPLIYSTQNTYLQCTIWQ